MSKILIYCPKITPRVQYVFEFILNEFLGISFELTTNLQFFEAATIEKISYSPQVVDNEYHLKSDAMMFEQGLDDALKREELHAVGRVFYDLSRYEEYFPQPLDQHQRISGKNKVFKTPVVDEWVLELKAELLRFFPNLNFKERNFKITLTCDVDQAWEFKHKGFMRTYGAFLKDLLRRDMRRLQYRKSVISGKAPDPYDTFEWFKDLKEKHHFQMIFFWLMADYGKFDKNNPVNNLAFQQKIRAIASWSDIGIHPSYASNQFPEKIGIEINRLHRIVNQTVVRSRQHYIKLHLPMTYRRLIAEGIAEDHSMAYADETGFRAGTSTPFFGTIWKKKQRRH